MERNLRNEPDEAFPVRCGSCGAITGGTAHNRWYAQRFERTPESEPWRSRWCRIEEQHAALLRVGDGQALVMAVKLADERYAIELERQRVALDRALDGIRRGVVE